MYRKKLLFRIETGAFFYIYITTKQAKNQDL